MSGSGPNSWWPLLLLLVLSGACGRKETASPTAAPDLDPATPSTAQLQARAVEMLWTSVAENYVHLPAFEAEWEQDRAGFVSQALTTAPTDFPDLIDQMLSGLPEDAVVWQSRTARIEGERANSRSYEGIGAFVSYRETPEPRILVLGVIEGSAAESAGLQGHESILAIDGEPVSAGEGLQASARIRGPAGTPVQLAVRNPSGAVREVTVQRQPVISAGQLRAGEFPETDVGYLLFPPVAYEEMDQDLLANLQVMTQAGERALDGLILDLRITTSRGGWPVDVYLAIFADGKLGDIVTREGIEGITVVGQDFLGSQSIPLAVLVGPDTQGAPELFAAYLQASGRATVLGLPTPGHVERQTEYALPDGSRAFISTMSYRTDGGGDVGLSGVTPDILIPVDWDEFSPGQDPVIEAALDLFLKE